MLLSKLKNLFLALFFVLKLCQTCSFLCCICTCSYLSEYFGQVQVSYVEIYNEEIRDLLTDDNRKLEIKGNHGAVAGRDEPKWGCIELNLEQVQA